jgi:hypothetical protein
MEAQEDDDEDEQSVAAEMCAEGDEIAGGIPFEEDLGTWKGRRGLVFAIVRRGEGSEEVGLTKSVPGSPGDEVSCYDGRLLRLACDVARYEGEGEGLGGPEREG